MSCYKLKNIYPVEILYKCGKLVKIKLYCGHLLRKGVIVRFLTKTSTNLFSFLILQYTAYGLYLQKLFKEQEFWSYNPFKIHINLSFKMRCQVSNVNKLQFGFNGIFRKPSSIFFQFRCYNSTNVTIYNNFDYYEP